MVDVTPIGIHFAITRTKKTNKNTAAMMNVTSTQFATLRTVMMNVSRPQFATMTKKNPENSAKMMNVSRIEHGTRSQTRGRTRADQT